MWKGCVWVTKIDVKVVVVRDQVSTCIGNYCHLFAKRKKKNGNPTLNSLRACSTRW